MNENNNNFEVLLNELEQIVKSMESGGKNLADSLKEFERGVQLFNNCQSILKTAQLHVQQLVEKQEGEVLVDYVELTSPGSGDSKSGS